MKINCTKGTPGQLEELVRNKIEQLSGNDIDSATDTAGIAAKPDIINAKQWKHIVDESLSSQIRSILRLDDPTDSDIVELQDLLIQTCDSIIDELDPEDPDDDYTIDSLEDLKDEISIHDPSDEEFLDDMNYVLNEFWDILDAGNIFMPVSSSKEVLAKDEISEDAAEIEEDYDGIYEKDDEYIEGLIASVESKLQGCDGIKWDDDGEHLHATMIVGDSITEYDIPYDDLTMDEDVDTDYILETMNG